MKPKKKKPPQPRPARRWAIMNTSTRQITSVYEQQYGKRYVQGDCEDGQIVVRVRVVSCTL